MTITSIASFIEVLRRFQLLEPQQIEELSNLPPGSPDPRHLARDLLQRGWLTPYQVNQLLQGKVQDLSLGQYVVIERLGQGGMGQVFKARHRRLDRIDALKVIRRDHLADAAAVQRFHQEARAAARVSHVNIVSIYDASEAGGTHFLAMEYVEGQDLAKMVQRNGPLPVEQACEYIRQAALGLQHAHERGLIHRDIKPSNLFVNSREGVVKVLDMGLARMLKAAHDGEAAAGLTNPGVVMGTPDYISPEQAMNSRQVDIRSDIYSLGGSLYFLLTGQAPFPGDSLTEKLLRRQLEDPRPLRELRPDVPPELAGVVATMMARKPEQRYATPVEVARALEPLVRGTAAAIPQQRSSGPPLVSSANPGSTATLAPAATLAMQPTAAPALGDRDGRAGVFGSVQQALSHAPAVYQRVRPTSRRGWVLAGVAFLGSFFLLVFLLSFALHALGRKPATVAEGPPIQPTTAVPSADGMEVIYQAFRVRHQKIEGGAQQRAGDQLGITYELVNVSQRQLTVPEDKNAPQSGGCSIGVCEHWIERLGSDPTIPGIPLSGGRRGNLYAVGKATVWADRVLDKHQTYQFANPLETSGYPPGRYRYHIEYQKHNGEVIHKEPVEFELTKPTPQDPRESLHVSLVGKPSIPLEVENWLNGSALSTSDLQGKVVLLDFWAVWCPPCRAAFPTLRSWHDKFEKNGLIIVGLTRYYGYGWNPETKAPRKIAGLSAQGEQDATVEFAKHHRLPYRIGFVPTASDLYKRYGVGGIPQVVLIDRQGKVRNIHVGYSPSSAKATEEMIVKLLAEK